VGASGLPHTIIRTGQIRDEPSGAGVQLGQVRKATSLPSEKKKNKKRKREKRSTAERD